MPNYKPKNLGLIEAYVSEDDADAEELLADLDWESGSPGTRRIKALWAARWDVYYQQKHRFVYHSRLSPPFQVQILTIIGCSIDRTPTIDDLLKFICGSALRGVEARPSPFAPPGTTPVPSRAWLSNCIRTVLGYLSFKYPNWKFDTHKRSRVNEVTWKLKKEGKITNDPKIIKSWAGLEVTRLLVYTLWESYSPPTNTSLAKIVSIVLNAALVARASSFMRADAYNGLETLLWKQVLFGFTDGVKKLENLYIIFTVSTKGADRELGTRITSTLKPEESTFK